MKKILVSIISLTLLGCLNISEAESENFDEREERAKNLEDSIVGLIETGVTFLNNELKKELNEKNHTNELKRSPIPPKLELKQEEEVEVEKVLSAVTGVWSNSHKILKNGISVVEINFDSHNNKTLKFKYTPDDYHSKFEKEVDVLYDILIKNIDYKKNTISFYLIKKGERFKEPLRENTIWSIKLINKSFSNDFNIELIMDNGELYELEWVREY
jgi:hypothetical protein